MNLFAILLLVTAPLPTAQEKADFQAWVNQGTPE